MRHDQPQPVIADRKGKIYNIEGLAAAGSEGGCFFKLRKDELIELPPGSELFILPGRVAVGYDYRTRSFVAIDHNPFSKKDKTCFAVAAFVSPGYTIAYNSAYLQQKSAPRLPLFSYAAACYYKGKIYTTAIHVDKGLQHDLRFMNIKAVRKNIVRFKMLFPKNRLIGHLARCALAYGCPNAKNFFLSRYEAPLPISPSCNCNCIGCISYQPEKVFPVTQPRIKFIPTPEEIAEIALFHIRNVKDPLVSFGQGCEGEPLTAGDILEESIRIIRNSTPKGLINLNTNASRPAVLKRLFDVGLDSIRVSMNSAQKAYYTMYYKPKRYNFDNVADSIDIAKTKNRFVSVNYLTLPGFSDSKGEFAAFEDFIRKHKIDMVQFRNLNIDPLYYFKSIGFSAKTSDLIGIKSVITLLKREIPSLMIGYFNPAKSAIIRHRHL
jgi:pyruvate-formate lyase-activating enzyme